MRYRHVAREPRCRARSAHSLQGWCRWSSSRSLGSCGSVRRQRGRPRTLCSRQRAARSVRPSSRCWVRTRAPAERRTGHRLQTAGCPCARCDCRARVRAPHRSTAHHAPVRAARVQGPSRPRALLCQPDGRRWLVAPPSERHQGPEPRRQSEARGDMAAVEVAPAVAVAGLLPQPVFHRAAPQRTRAALRAAAAGGSPGGAWLCRAFERRWRRSGRH